MSYFIRNGNSYRVAADEALDIQKVLPVGNYTVKFDQMSNTFFLEMVDSFTPVKKMYGDTVRHTQRILNTFNERSSSTGVMLAGEKGSGKSLLAKNLSIEAAKDGIPTIVINAAYTGDGFNAFIQNIEQPCVILFDEFEKVYDGEDQEKALTLLDGVYPTKKLFVLTCNNKYRIDENMRNRPGRIFYMLDYKGLDSNFIIEYCNDNLNNKVHIDKIVELAALFEQFNFDMLKALVEEMNRYNESPQESLKMLNAKPEYNNGGNFDCKLFVDGKQITNVRELWNGNPLTGTVYFEYDAKPEDPEADSWTEVEFTPNHIVKVDAHAGSFVYQNEKGDTCTLIRKKDTGYNYLAY